MSFPDWELPKFPTNHVSNLLYRFFLKMSVDSHNSEFYEGKFQ